MCSLTSFHPYLSNIYRYMYCYKSVYNTHTPLLDHSSGHHQLIHQLIHQLRWLRTACLFFSRTFMLTDCCCRVWISLLMDERSLWKPLSMPSIR